MGRCNCGNSSCNEYEGWKPAKAIPHTHGLRAGALMVLKSGGPPVTLCDVEDDKITIAWFADDGGMNLISGLPLAAFEELPHA